MNDAARRMINLTRSGIVCDHLVVADRPLARMRGLLGRASLPAGEGLLLRPAPSIHTALMRFPIDVVFLDKDLRVLKLVEHLAPWRTASARRARAALELSAGEASRRGLAVGDVLGVGDEPDSGRAPTDPRAVPDPVIGCQSDSGNGAHAATRVLLITTDRRFRALAATLLTRRGCSVTSRERMTNVPQLATRHRADVVVLDATNSLRATAHQALLVEALEPRVGVVMVADRAACMRAQALMLTKWESFDALYSAIEDARAHVSVRSR